MDVSDWMKNGKKYVKFGNHMCLETLIKKLYIQKQQFQKIKRNTKKEIK